ncbi:MAG: class I SAM-dependent methyltransferase [Anaerocolumna sp.]
MLIEQKRIPERTEEVCDGQHYIKRVKAMMVGEHYPFLVERMIKEVGFGPGKALEIGPGPMPMGFSFCKQTQWDVIGIDISEEIVELARKELKKEEQNGHYRIKVANAECMPFSDEMFNFVFSSGSLHHWLNPVKVFQEINRVLAPGGTVLIFDLCREHYGDDKYFDHIMGTVKKEFKQGLLDSIKAAYVPEEIYHLILESGTLDIWKRIQFEQYHGNMLQLNQAVILQKPLLRQIRLYK